MSEETKIKMLLAWHDRATRANLAHYFQAEKCSRLNGALTIFNLLAAISVLFLVNSNFIPNVNLGSSFLLSAASLAVVLTTALHYVLKLDERSHDHKSAGNEFTAIKRKIERMLTNGNISDNDIKEIELEHNHTSKNHNLVNQSVWTEIRPRYEQACEENASFFESLLISEPQNSEDT